MYKSEVAVSFPHQLDYKDNNNVESQSFQYKSNS